ncbi:hypothetical protein TWF102_002302 [Orbilia oligospora]|uniref:Nucleoside phosphorylase domain-containing protein n=1 Tax=Orbilia oligospora TaxID=2813651 RepID=A0A7C8JFB4_ORBOL|nr:hypothetical protein TWF103_008720 [Orbilia oligospora]KAF3105381.1 hypothetical protein TWF102_002302 [Orbilia oligospora]
MAILRRPYYRDDFEIAIICALKVEFDAVEVLLDEVWEGNGSHAYGKAPGDPNAYTTGLIGTHPVVLTYMPGVGKTIAGNVAASLRSSFLGIKLCLVVGICGGVPENKDDEDDEDGNEILLGDIVISTGIVEYDFGHQYSDQVVRNNNYRETLSRPNHEIRAFLAKMGGYRCRTRLTENIPLYLADISAKEGFGTLRYPGADQDKLFEPTYIHKHHTNTSQPVCVDCQDRHDATCDTALGLSCTENGCDASKQITRKRLEKIKHTVGGSGASLAALEGEMGIQSPQIHFGAVASGDLSMMSAYHRDKIAAKDNVIAFERTAAGIWDAFPTVIIKGVCNYADSHKNEVWERYAAATAAACMKGFLREWITADKPVRRDAVEVSNDYLRFMNLWSSALAIVTQDRFDDKRL